MRPQLDVTKQVCVCTARLRKKKKHTHIHINLLGTKVENLELELRCPLTTIPSKFNCFYYAGIFDAGLVALWLFESLNYARGGRRD